MTTNKSIVSSFRLIESKERYSFAKMPRKALCSLQILLVDTIIKRNKISDILCFCVLINYSYVIKEKRLNYYGRVDVNGIRSSVQKNILLREPRGKCFIVLLICLFLSSFSSKLWPFRDINTTLPIVTVMIMYTFYSWIGAIICWQDNRPCMPINIIWSS